MKMVKVLSVLVVLAGVGLLAQASQRDAGPGARALFRLAGRGSEIGVSIRDVEASDKAAAGVMVEEVQADGPAGKAGLKRSDVIVEFDGEHVRSARQFTRLVQETAPGRAVKATFVRDGQRKDVQITPGDGREGMVMDGERLREGLTDLGRMTDRALPFDFRGGNFSFAFPRDDLGGRGRLGISVEELTPQLATYFGAKDGVLVASISEDSPASRAGLKAGDVITTANQEPVRSREDLMRLMRDVKDGGDAAIGIVRDKKASTVTVKLDASTRTRTRSR